MKTLLQLHDEEQREAAARDALRLYDERLRQVKRGLLGEVLKLLLFGTLLGLALAEALRR